MSRSSYGECDDFPNQLELYRGNVRRSMLGKAGQARLRELHAALVALPVKELEAETFAEGTPETPEVCALGAWALAKAGGDPSAAKAILRPRVWRENDDEETADDLKPHGWPRLVVYETIFINDEGNYREAETPAQRYTRVLAWVEDWLNGKGD